jgi:hypothetical protein
MASTTVPLDESLTDATLRPTHTATQPTGAPSAVPKVPVPRTSIVVGAGAATVGRGTEPLPTALSVDISITSCPHSAAGWDGTVPTDTGPMRPGPVDGVEGMSGIPMAVPGDLAAPVDGPPPPAVPL